MCAWVFVAMLSVIERQHVGYPLLVVPIGLLLAGAVGARLASVAESPAAVAVVVPALLLWHRYPLSLMSGVAYVIGRAVDRSRA